MGRPGIGRPGVGRPGKPVRPGDRFPHGRPINHLPTGHHSHHHRGHDYYYHGHHWWRPYWYGGYVRYWPAYPPPGYYYPRLPDDYSTTVINNNTYYLADGVYYQKGEQDGASGYVVVQAPEATGEPEVTSSADVPDPFETLRAASDYLGKLKEFTVIGSSTHDEVLDSGEKIQSSGRRTVSVKRPNKVAVEFRGDGDNRRAVYDGKTVTVLSRTRKMYASISVPDTISAALDVLAQDYGMTVPMSDLMRPDAYDSLVGNVRTGQYVGLHTVGVYRCHHLAFTQDAVDWEIWIQSGDRPLPRKLSISYKGMSGNPRYTLILPRWDLSPVAEDKLRLEIPSDAKKIEVLPATPVEDAQATKPRE